LLFEGSSSCLYSVDDDAQGITSLEGGRPYDWKMTGFKTIRVSPAISQASRGEAPSTVALIVF
jgi:hypothetical protein